MRTLPALVLLTFLSVACNKEKPEDKAPSSEGKKDDKVEKKDDSDKKSDKKKDDSDKKSDDKTEKKDDKKAAKKPEPPKKEKVASDKLASYWKAMTEGRKATIAKKYDDAYAAFDRALKVIPDDPRAVSERGYAKLLAKDYKGAVADLDKAVVHTSDKKLLGQIYFNYGLAAEGQGDAEAARAAFARSNTYNPTSAAKKKLEGKSVCSAKIEEKKPFAETHTYASWKEAYTAAVKDRDGYDAFTSEDATLSKFCTNKWKKGDSCVALLGDFIARELHIFVPTKGGKIVEFDLDIVGGRCGGDLEPKLVSDENDVTHLFWKSMQGTPVLVTEKNGEMVPCGEKDEDCTTACGDEGVSFADLFIAKDSGESMLYIDRGADEKGGDPLKVTVDGPTVTVKGKGCDGEHPLAK